MSYNFQSKNPELIEQKLARFMPDTTRIVTDFGSTLTRYNGKTSWSLFAESDLMPSEYVEARNELKEEFYPYENDPTLSAKKRQTYMQTWWQKHLSLLSEFRLKESALAEIVSRQLIPRKGILDLLSGANTQNIPVLIFSDSITESIEVFLRTNGMLYSNITIVANSLQFDSEGFCVGYSDPVIPTGGKHEAVLDEKVKTTYSGRSNVLLFGDSPEDIDMVGQIQPENIVTVGFCNSNNLGQKEAFMEKFDIVIETDDTDTGVSKELLNRIVENRPNI